MSERSAELVLSLIGMGEGEIIPSPTTIPHQLGQVGKLALGS